MTCASIPSATIPSGIGSDAAASFEELEKWHNMPHLNSTAGNIFVHGLLALSCKPDTAKAFLPLGARVKYLYVDAIDSRPNPELPSPMIF